ncbi:hypothetical protein DK59_2978 [Brucella abortus bv. 4 str. 292]|nr:hypothetical protein DK59_2978 [Brucella abortus bv. 4 str. 292]
MRMIIYGLPFSAAANDQLNTTNPFSCMIVCVILQTRFFAFKFSSHTNVQLGKGWVMRRYSPAETPSGTMISVDLTANPGVWV